MSENGNGNGDGNGNGNGNNVNGNNGNGNNGKRHEKEPISAPVIILYPYTPPPFLGNEVDEARAKQEQCDVRPRYLAQYFQLPDSGRRFRYKSSLSPYVTERTPKGKKKQRTGREIKIVQD